MATSISSILIPCLQSFKQLQERVDQPSYCCEEEVSSVAWGDELGRLRVWAANIGAHQTGQSSLDFRLRDASHISKQVTNLLHDLDQSLNNVLEEISEEAGTEDSEDNGTSAACPDENPTTELQQLHEEIVNIIDCLYQLSMLIRKPAQHDLLVGSHIGDKAEFEFYDQEHIRNLHPKTEEQISQRLGHAITRRRQYFGYRERHHRKLAEGIQRTTTGSIMSETVATDFKTQNIDFEETSSNSGMSQTSYAPSLIDGGRVTIPPPPKESEGGKPFECPYCFFLIDIKTTRSWNRHIFKDIKPYICTFPDCSMPDRLYDSRREWHLHETNEHLREGRLVCALCRESLKSAKQYERHVARHLEELALFALPRIEADDAEDDDNDVVSDARAFPFEYRDPFKTTNSLDHSHHSTSPSETDEAEEEDLGNIDVQVLPGSPNKTHEYSGPAEGRADWSHLSSLVDDVHKNLEKKMKKLIELEEKEKEEIILEEAKKTKKKQEEEEFKQKALEEYHLQQLEEKAKKEQEKKEADEEFRKRAKKTFGEARYEEKQIEKILNVEKRQKEYHSNEEIKDLTRPTYIKVNKKHMSPETLDAYDLPWGWDERDSNYIIIKQWIPESDQNALFDHTKKLREKTGTEQSTKKPREEAAIKKKRKSWR